jgi:hypothetical protein
MYKIEQKDFGIKYTFGGVMTAQELSKWVDEVTELLDQMKPQFCVFVDMRSLAPLDPEGQAVMQEGQKAHRIKGLLRSVVIVNSPVVKMQFKHIAIDTGIYDYERYIDASAIFNWEQVGLDWLLKAKDPTLQTAMTARISIPRRR